MIRVYQSEAIMWTTQSCMTSCVYQSCMAEATEPDEADPDEADPDEADRGHLSHGECTVQAASVTQRGHCTRPREDLRLLCSSLS